MEEKKPTLEELLKTMEKMSGGDPRPMRVLSQINPEFVFEQARGRKFVMDLPLIPPKYKHLIMIAVAAPVESDTLHHHLYESGQDRRSNQGRNRRGHHGGPPGQGGDDFRRFRGWF